jgi:predicted dehydrogenase
MSEPLRFGCIGVAGYAASLIQMFDQAIPRQRAVLCAVDVSHSQPDDTIREILQRHGATQVDGVDSLLAREDLDAAIVPTSIDSHRAFTVKALEYGLHVHCEKPVAPTVQDADAMIAQRDRAGRIVAVGFQHTCLPSVQWAKRLILDGAIGPVRRVLVRACWPRDDAYYRRNDWAGCIQRHGGYVLDSPASNALAHQLNLALYFCGPDEYTSAQPAHLRAELYRARPIENYDTCGIHATTGDDQQILILLTHACEGEDGPVVEVIGENGSILRPDMTRSQLIRGGGVIDECADALQCDRAPMFENLLDAIEGRVDRVFNSIENARAVTKLFNGASECTPVRTIDPQFVKQFPSKQANGGSICAIADIESIFLRCCEQFLLPSEAGAPWAMPAGCIDLVGYDQFKGVAGVD